MQRNWSARMRRYVRLLTIIGLLAISGCGEDALVPCDEHAEWSGLLCREYRFGNNVPVGYLEYSYKGDSVIDITTNDTEGRLQKTATERYSGGLIRTVVERFEGGQNLVRSYNYLSNDSLECIVFGAADSSECYGYDAQGRRSSVVMWHGSEKVRSVDYRYFVDQDRLYRLNFYDGNDSLLRYWNHEYFLDGRIRIDVFTGQNSFLGHYVQNWTADGRLLNAQFTAPDQAITERTDLTYDADGRLTERNVSGPFVQSRLVYMYH